MIHTARGKAIMMPTYMPVARKAETRERSLVGIQRAMLVYKQGGLIPSPSPSATRIAIIDDVVCAKGVSIVTSDHHVTAPPRIPFAPQRSESHPPRICVRK